MRDCFLLHLWRWRRLWPTTTLIRGRNGTGYSVVLSFRSRGSRSLRKRLPDYQLRRLEQASAAGVCQCFSVLIQLLMSLAFANSMLEWRVPVPVEELLSSRLR